MNIYVSTIFACSVTKVVYGRLSPYEPSPAEACGRFNNTFRHQRQEPSALLWNVTKYHPARGPWKCVGGGIT